jgi:cytochrome c
MRTHFRNSLGAATVAVAGALAALPGAVAAACAPADRRSSCAPKGKCAAKAGCSAKPGCAPKGGCGPAAERVDRKLVSRPAGYRPYRGNHADLVRHGEALFKDTKLSTNGLSCNTCHTGGGAYMETFAKPYPHFVQMVADRSGMNQVQADEMVQLCMVVPMAARPLAWESKELAALTTYVTEVQKTFKPAAGTKAGCSAKAGCGAKAGCAAKCAPKATCAPKAGCTPRGVCGALN